MRIINYQSKKVLLIFFFIIVSAIGSVWILKSDGFYFIDECAHYLFCRFVLQALPITVQTWHRPIPQWLFALPAQLGHSFTMFFALALFLCLLFFTYKIAVLKGIKNAEWVVLLTGLQPSLFDISYACMTEVPAALMITLTYWCHLKNKHGCSILLASLVFLCRSEMLIFAGLMFLVYLWKREWKILPLILVGPILWIGSTTIISGNIMTFFHEWSYFSGLGKFIPGATVTHYFENLHTAFGIAQVILFIGGILFITLAKKSAEYGILYGTIAITIIIHTIAGSDIFHWTGSIGELRYITVIGPFFGIISVYGFSEILERMKSSTGRLTVSIAVLCIVVFNCTLTTHPRHWANYDRVVINMAKAIKIENKNLTLLSNNCAAAYIMDVAPSGGENFAPLDTLTLQEYPECLILWDPYTSSSIYHRASPTKEKVLKDPNTTILEKYYYWGTEYLLLYKNGQGTTVKMKENI
jgi:hypothetical protein